jgi:3-methyladenine DNA glycosylase AlkD
MNKIEAKFLEIREYCEKNADPAIEQKYARYFTEGYDAYGVESKKFEKQRDEWLKAWKDELSLDEFIMLGDKLIASGKYEEGGCAITFISAQKDKLTKAHFERIGTWLDEWILNWGHTDVLCGYVLSHFITSELVEPEGLSGWTKSPSKWKRRAVPVTLIDALKKDFPYQRLFDVIDPLMPDAEKFVQKGLGWFLREAWKRQPEVTEKFMLKWKDTCGRTIIQYATEKMDKEKKAKFKKAR